MFLNDRCYRTADSQAYNRRSCAVLQPCLPSYPFLAQGKDIPFALRRGLAFESVLHCVAARSIPAFALARGSSPGPLPSPRLIAPKNVPFRALSRDAVDIGL